MFDQLPPEKKFQILSYLKNSELLHKSSVSKEWKSLTETALSDRIKAYYKPEILNDSKRRDECRKELRQLCLNNPKWAKIVLEIDAKETRYLLLEDDLRDIGMSNPEVALVILKSADLARKKRRVGIYRFSVKFSEVADFVFSDEKFKEFLSAETILDIIKEKPEYFEKIKQDEKLIKKISQKPEYLREFAKCSEEIAFYIIDYSTDKLNDVRYQWFGEIGYKYKNVAMALLNNTKISSQLDPPEIFHLGEKHIEAAQFIIENPVLCKNLDDKQFRILDEKVVEHTSKQSLTL